MNRNAKAQISKETVEISNEGGYKYFDGKYIELPSLKKAIEETIVYAEGESPEIEIGPNKFLHTKINVTFETTCQAALRIS